MSGQEERSGGLVETQVMIKKIWNFFWIREELKESQFVSYSTQYYILLYDF